MVSISGVVNSISSGSTNTLGDFLKHLIPELVSREKLLEITNIY